MRNPSVFGRWPAEYAAQGEIADAGMVSPELFTLDENGVNKYHSNNGDNGGVERLGNQATADDLNLTRTNMAALVDKLILQMTANTAPASYVNSLKSAYTTNPTRTDQQASETYRYLLWEISVTPWAVVRK
jgi:hypothetical protein